MGNMKVSKLFSSENMFKTANKEFMSNIIKDVKKTADKPKSLGTELAQSLKQNSKPKQK